MRLKIECPTEFYSREELRALLSTKGLVEDDVDPDAIMVNPGTDSFLDAMYFAPYPSLRYVLTPSTGINHIDTLALDSADVVLLSLLDNRSALEGIHASAEFTWLHIMNLARKFHVAIRTIDAWRQPENEQGLRSVELHGKSLGIIGAGRIGTKLIGYANAFGMKVCFFDPNVSAQPGATKVKEVSDVANCDIISVNCIMNAQTKGMITYGTLDDVKAGTIVVNTSRGEVVDEEYIAQLIENNGISYATDVLCFEQDPERMFSSDILELRHAHPDRVVVTPHVAGATIDSQKKAFEGMLDALLARSEQDV